MNLNCYVPDGLLPILISFPTYDTSCKFSKLFYENYRDLPQHKVLFDEYVIHTNNGYTLGSIKYLVEYFQLGIKNYEEWTKNGKHHRKDGPAYISYYGNGKRCCKKWFINGVYKNGKMYDLNGNFFTLNMLNYKDIY